MLGIGLALVFGFVGTAAASALIYAIFAPEHIGWRSILRGTLWSASTISVLSLGFALVADLGGNFQEHYGTNGMAAIVLLAVWLFLANALLLVGYRVALDT